MGSHEAQTTHFRVQTSICNAGNLVHPSENSTARQIREIKVDDEQSIVQKPQDLPCRIRFDHYR